MTQVLNEWFRQNARDLPWRDPSTSAWGILVSEFMSQQTQVERVIPHWEDWMTRWPKPSDLASDAPGEAVRAWKRLGYPRRALWLHKAATQIATEHNDEVPHDVDVLLSLTGIGPYTARAVAAFAFGAPEPVVDTNTRRVIARAVHGIAAAGMPAARDLEDMSALLPSDHREAAVFNAAAMELGAIVCTARKPACSACPIAELCEWRGSGFPDNAPVKRPKQAKFEGSDRQVRGLIMAAMRAAAGPLTREAAIVAGVESGAGRGGVGSGGVDSGGVDSGARSDQAQRAYDSLIADGLIVEYDGKVRLP